MLDSTIAHALDILESIEDKIIRNTLPYTGQAVARLYKDVRILKECAIRLRSNASSSRVDDIDSVRQVENLSDLVTKIDEVSRRQTSSHVLQVISEDIKKLNEQVTDISLRKDTQAAREAENEKLRSDLMQYQKVLEEMDRRFRAYEKRAQKVEAAADTLSQSAEMKTSQDWSDEYEKYIINEKSHKGVGVSHNSKMYGKVWSWLCGMTNRLFHAVFIDAIFYNGQSYSNRVKKYQFWRSFWLSLLSVLAVLYLVILWDYDFGSKDFVVFLLEKSKFIPLLVILSIGFAYASKNHRINLHLLEQYKHRYVVAKTMNNLMTLDGLKDERVTAELIQQGSKVLFEFRTSGYASKQDKDSLDYKAILDSMLSRKDS